MKTIRIAETFLSVQGEGFHTGTPCYFIRLQGCTLRCDFCDSKSTWDLDGGIAMAIHEIVDAVPAGLGYVVITGGEPTLQENIVELVEGLIWNGCDVHVETSGIHYDILKKLKSMPNVWITISPKYHRLPSSEALLLADEIKWIIQEEQDFWVVDGIFDELTHMTGNFPPTFFLQPVSQDLEATELCVEHVIKNAHREYQLSIQVQKYIGVR